MSHVKVHRPAAVALLALGLCGAADAGEWDIVINGRSVHVDLGAVGFLMTRPDVRDNAPFPGILPAVSVGTRQFAVNLTYLPGRIAEEVAAAKSADPNLDGILFIQFKLNVGLLSPRLGRNAEHVVAGGAD